MTASVRARPAGPEPEARQAILDLLADTTWALDAHDLDAFMAHWADNGVFAEVTAAGEARRWAGVAAIRAEMAARFAGPVGHQHRLSNHLFLPLPDGRPGWLVWSYWSTSSRDPAGAVTFAGTGWLRDELIPSDGRWLLTRRSVGPWGTPPLPHPLSNTPDPADRS